MAKSKKTEKITTTHQFSVEGILNVDNLCNEMISIELEDEGEVDLCDYIKKFNTQNVKIIITNKTEELVDEE